MSSIFQKIPFNYQFQVGIDNAFDYENVAVTINGVVADTLMQELVIKGNSLVQDGQMIRVYACGNGSPGLGNKRLRYRIGTNLVFDSGNIAMDNLAWLGTIVAIRRNSASMIGYARFEVLGIPPTERSSRIVPVNLNFLQDIPIGFYGDAPAAEFLIQDFCAGTIT